MISHQLGYFFTTLTNVLLERVQSTQEILFGIRESQDDGQREMMKMLREIKRTLVRIQEKQEAMDATLDELDGTLDEVKETIENIQGTIGEIEDAVVEVIRYHDYA